MFYLGLVIFITPTLLEKNLTAQNYVTEVGEAIILKFKTLFMKDGNNWYLVLCKPKMEIKVMDALSKRGIENFHSLTAITKRFDKQRKTAYKPLFEQCIFLCITSVDMLMVQKIDGVQNFVYWRDKPVVITNAEICLLKTFTTTYADVFIEKIDVHPQDDISSSGKQLYYELKEFQDEHSQFVKIQLPSIGYALGAAIVKSKVEVININRSRSFGSRMFRSSTR